MKMTCIVVDDEVLAITLLKKYIEQTPDIELKYSTTNPVSALEFLKEETVDVLFLDIQMPGLTGLELLAQLPNKPVIIFTTAYADYALEGYQLEVTDYLLKPFSLDRFKQAIAKAKKLIALKSKAFEKAGALSMPVEKDFINVKADHKIYKVKFDEIRFIEGLKEYVSFYTGDQRIIALESLKRLESLLPENKFIRVHKSYIVAIDEVKALEGNLLDIGDKKIPVGKTYRQEIVKKIFGESI